MIKKYLKSEKIVGYAILIAGLCIMGYGIFSVITVFSGGEIPLKLLQAENQNTDATDQTSQMPDLREIIEPLFPMFNALIWAVIALLIIAAGGRVARIGIAMMKVSIPEEIKIYRNEIDNKKTAVKTKTDTKINKKESKKT
jgi:hypothetical protein